MPVIKISVNLTQNAIASQLPQQAKFQHRLKRAIPEPPDRHPLRIERLPDALQWWSEPHYWLIHKESGLRVPGSFGLAEARYIRQISQNWDWSIDGSRRVACGLLALAEAVCDRSAKGGAK